MNQIYLLKKIAVYLWIFLAISVCLGAAVSAQETNTESSKVGDVTVEPVGEGEWRITNQDGQFVGTLKSERQQSFTFYDTSGVFIGTILESKAWLHRLYRKRDTRVTPEEARLYIDALKAIEILEK